MMDSYHGILFVGDSERGQELHAAAGDRGWFVYRPTEAMEALAMYVFYSPSAVVIEAGSDFARGVYRHLHSIQVEPVLILADNRAQRAERDLLAGSSVMPSTASADEIMAALATQINTEQVATV